MTLGRAGPGQRDQLHHLVRVRTAEGNDGEVGTEPGHIGDPRHATAENDPLWRLPLWQPYDAMLDSKVADLNNVASNSFAGSILCALFLQRFVERAKAWLHLDIFAWTPTAKPGRPEGGECQAARAVYALLVERYG